MLFSLHVTGAEVELSTPPLGQSLELSAHDPEQFLSFSHMVNIKQTIVVCVKIFL